jgi:hypothetical protein
MEKQKVGWDVCFYCHDRSYSKFMIVYQEYPPGIRSDVWFGKAMIKTLSFHHDD